MSTGKDLVLYRQRLTPWRNDQEFLPGALLILETPASPITGFLTCAICGLAVAAVVWSYLGRIDVIATAPGKFQPAGRVKIVQPLETGRVLGIHASNGTHVAAGDPLVELDGTESRAEAAALDGNLKSLIAEAARRREALKAATEEMYVASIPWPADVPVALRAREDRVLAADLKQLSSTMSSLKAQLDQKSAESASLADTVKAEKDLISVLQDRVDMKSHLVALDAGTKASLLDALETLRYQVTTLATQTGQWVQAKTGSEVIRQDLAKARDTFISENSQKLADDERQIDEDREKMVKAQATADNMTVRSPVAGTVQASTVTNIGQVVATGNPLMRIVPDGTALEIEAYAQNRDIGFLHVGQEAVVKVESFPFGQYGGVKARVSKIATDAIPEPDARAMEGDPTKASAPDMATGGEKTQNLVFPITLIAESPNFVAEGRKVPLSPGMSVSVEIKTGRRRILEFLFAPLVETASSALSER